MWSEKGKAIEEALSPLFFFFFFLSFQSTELLSLSV